LPKAQAERWAERVRRLVPAGWTVSIRGNDVVIQRDRQVRFAEASINAPPGDRRPTTLQEGPYRLTLRFARRMSLDEYEALAAMNAASETQRDRLLAESRLPHKFGQIIATTPDEEVRFKAYREAESRLPRHDLPNLYTPDHSIHLYQSWDPTSSVHDEDAAHECRDVRDCVLRFFGKYNPDVAAGRTDPAWPEP
jgi:hypothetical protein